MWEILNVVDSVDIHYKLNGIPLMDYVLRCHQQRCID